jgi:hypothetical protein
MVKVKKGKLIENDLSQIWLDPQDPAGFAGVQKLSKASKTSKSKTQKWLSNQLAYSLNKPMRRKFPTRSYRTGGINDLSQMDLMEMIPLSRINSGYKYILTCIDVFSRYGRAMPLKSKGANEIETALQIMLKKKRPYKIQTDLGKEFYNKVVNALFKKFKIIHYSIHSQFKAAVW